MLDFVVMRILGKYPFLGKLCAIVGLFLLPVGAFMFYNFNQLLHSPNVTTGTIESLPSSVKDGGTVSYQYRVAGAEYQNKVDMSSRELSLMDAGGSIPVHYNSSDPASSVAEGATPHSAIVVITLSVILLFFPIFTKIAVKRDLKRRQRRARI